MPIDSVITSPHRRSQAQNAFTLPTTLKRQLSRGDETGSCKTLIQRHRFLLTALILLVVLCTVYLYFAVTLGSEDSCSGLTGSRKVSCLLQQTQSSADAKGKLKFF